MYEYYRIEKQEIFCMLLMLPLRLFVEPVFCSFLLRYGIERKMCVILQCKLATHNE